MSLKTFHVLFILCAIGVTAWFGYWALDARRPAAWAAFAAAAGLAVYEVVFLRKCKAL